MFDAASGTFGVRLELPNHTGALPGGTGEVSVQADRITREPDGRVHLEGHAMLRDGTTMSDILVRRAVVAGLARISDSWSTEILQALQVEDEQWVVRNAAAEALELRSRAEARAPRLLPAPSKSPWLLEFAGTMGVGIPPGSSGIEVLISALKSEISETRLAALSYLKMSPTQPVVMQLYHAMYSDDPRLREAIYVALMEIAAGGIKLPHPSQFGLG